MVVSPAPLTSQSVDGLPVRQFSATIALGGDRQAADAGVLKVHVTLAASALPARSLMRGSVVPPARVTLYVVDPGSVVAGVNVTVLLALL